MTWPAGDSLDVLSMEDHLDVIPALGAGTGRAISGLLGNHDGDVANDLALRDGGAPLPRPIAGVTDPRLVPACTLDVAVGQSPVLATAYSGLFKPKATLPLAYYAADFESDVGAEWSRTAVATTGGSSLYGPTRYLGPFGDDAVTLTLANTPAHDTVSLTFDLYVIGAWSGGDGTLSAPAHQAISMTAAGLTLLDASFSNGPEPQSYPDVLASDHANPAGTGATATNALGVSIGGSPSNDTVYHQRFTFADPSGAPLAIVFSASGLDTSGGETWGIDNIEVDLSSGGTTTAGGVTFVHGVHGDPTVVGCADGTREAFLDPASYPKIAGCMATWSGAVDMRAPGSGVPCGDAIGPCTSPADARAGGWHVCGSTGAVSELRALSPLECTNAGNGMFISAISHCASQDTSCQYDESADATYACYPSGWCSEAVCCGVDCARLGACPGGVWDGLTHITPSESNGCGATTAPADGGVLCCAP